MSIYDDKPYTFDRVVRIIIGIIIAAVVIWLLDYLSSVLIPFVIAFILAYMINPFVDFIQKYVKKRIIAVILALLVITSVIVGIAMMIIPLIVAEINHMGELLAQLVNEKGLEAKMAAYLPEGLSKRIEEFIAGSDLYSYFNADSLEKLADLAFNKLLPSIGNVFSETLNVIIGLFGFAIILLYLIFLLLDYHHVSEEWKNLIPPRYRDKVLHLIHDFEEAMHNYFRAQALIASIVGVLFAIGFSIIGLPMGIVLGLFIGMLNMVPYLQNIGFIPAAFFALIYSLETGYNFWYMMGLVLLVFAVVQAIQDGFLTPKIMGNATGLNAAVILLSLSIWGKLLGMLGLLIALPMTYLILTYYRRFLAKAKAMQKTDKT